VRTPWKTPLVPREIVAEWCSVSTPARGRRGESGRGTSGRERKERGREGRTLARRLDADDAH